MVTNKHKAATSVTLAPLAEKSAFEQLVSAYWKPAAVLAVVIVSVVVFLHRRQEARTSARRQSWESLIQTAGMSGFSPNPTASPEVLARTSSDLAVTEAGPWAALLEAQAKSEKRDFAGARGALEAARRAGSKGGLAEALWPSTSGTGRDSALDRMSAAVAQQETWIQQHPGLFAIPPAPKDAPRLRLKTSAGDITVALSADAAPAHAANFLKLASEGYYNGTKFHHIVAGQRVDGGDPNTRTDDRSSWGKGAGDKQLPVEATGLFHFSGVLSAAPGATPGTSSGSLFTLTCEAGHDLDDKQVVFGIIEDGIEVVRAISRGAAAADTPETPTEPVTLNAIERL